MEAEVAELTPGAGGTGCGEIVGRSTGSFGELDVIRVEVSVTTARSCKPIDVLECTWCR